MSGKENTIRWGAKLMETQLGKDNPNLKSHFLASIGGGIVGAYLLGRLLRNDAVYRAALLIVFTAIAIGVGP